MMQTATFLSVEVYVGLVTLPLRTEMALLHFHIQNTTDLVFLLSYKEKIKPVIILKIRSRP